MAISRAVLNRNQVYHYLRDAILSGEIKANEKIVESKYTELLQVSRTPVREALRMLEYDRLVIHIPQRGVYARSAFTKNEIREIYFFRRTLQLAIVDATIENATEEDISGMDYYLTESESSLRAHNYEKYIQSNNGFNTGLIEACHMEIVFNALKHSEQTGPLISFTDGDVNSSGYLKIKDRFAESIEEHKKILDAIKSKDKDGLRKALETHIDNVENAFLNIAEE